MLGKTPTEKQKEIFRELAIEKIVSRTLGGDDINGVQFEEYSEAYAKKKGVTKDSVDLFLNGDLLPSIDEVKTRQGNMVKIAVKGKTNNLVSFNHNVGDTLPERRFFGLTQEDAEELADRVSNLRPSESNDRRTIADIIDQIELEQIE